MTDVPLWQRNKYPLILIGKQKDKLQSKNKV